MNDITYFIIIIKKSIYLYLNISLRQVKVLYHYVYFVFQIGLLLFKPITSNYLVFLFFFFRYSTEVEPAAAVTATQTNS